MGETDLHRGVMVAAIDTLKMYYAAQSVYVSGNILLYYRPGNKRRRVSPDVMVVKGLQQRDRDNYLLWEEGKAPNVVIEVTSESTREEDLQDKLEIYRDEIGVAEYRRLPRFFHSLSMVDDHLLLVIGPCSALPRPGPTGRNRRPARVRNAPGDGGAGCGLAPLRRST